MLYPEKEHKGNANYRLRRDGAFKNDVNSVSNIFLTPLASEKKTPIFPTAGKRELLFTSEKMIIFYFVLFFESAIK